MTDSLQLHLSLMCVKAVILYTRSATDEDGDV